MTKEEYLEFHAKSCQRLIEITRAKNADYTGASNDPFANFRQVEQSGICSVEVGFLTRMSDKMSRIASFVAKGELKVKDESVTDTLLDLANYCILMAGYIASKNELSTGQKAVVRERNLEALVSSVFIEAEATDRTKRFLVVSVANFIELREFDMAFKVLRSFESHDTSTAIIEMLKRRLESTDEEEVGYGG